ncbi:MAG: inosine/xanthosine triphosphatase [Bacillota bacterium]
MNSQMLRIAVGSANPVKVNAARRIFDQLYPACEVLGIDVASGVPAQPVGEEETVAGAANRARAALAALGADFGVGLEGGVVFEGDECWMINCCTVVHRDGQMGIGKGQSFLLPPVVAEGVRAGHEVGPLVDRLSGESETRKKGGAIGFLTNGTVLREDLFAATVGAALVQFLHPELYKR